MRAERPERARARAQLARAGAPLGLAAIALALSLAPAACRTPTEITVEIAAELAHRSDMAVAVQIDTTARVESAPPRVVTREAWAAGATIGTVVVVPGGDDDEVVVRVVLATARDPSACTASDATGCVVVRRRLRFTRGESTRARVVLRPSCLAVFCDASTSCAADGRCGSLDSDAATGDAGDAPLPTIDAGDPYVTAVLEDRPRHYYRLDEPPGATVARDLMGRADGTYGAGVKLGVTGALKASVDPGAFFDGSSAGVTIPRAEDLPGAFSIEAWARADTGDGPRPTIVERVDQVGSEAFGYRVSKPPGSSATFEVFRGATAFVANAQANRFAGYSHLVAVARGGELVLWLDGREAATTPLGDTKASAVLGPLVVGASRAGASAFRGAIDEVAIYDYPLDAAQVKKHYDVAEAK